MIFDSHIHTRMSTDSQMSADEAIAAAKEKGLGLIFTEHYDTDYIGNDVDFRVDPKSYLKEYSKYKEKNNNVLLGIEIGLNSGEGYNTTEENKNLAESYSFDYVIGSIHMVREYDIYTEFVKKPQPQITGEMYYTHMLNTVRANDWFDSLAHMDYPGRYLEGRADFSFATFKNTIKEIFECLIDRNQAVEINTRRMGDREAVREMYEAFKLYRSLGGRYVTIGSDAHVRGDIGMNFTEGVKLAKNLELDIVYYKNRERISI